MSLSRLQLRSTARFSLICSDAVVTASSVVTYLGIVAMLGGTMPALLVMPAMLIPQTSVTLPVFDRNP